MKCPVELSNKAEVRLHRLFADLLTPDKAKGVDTQPLRFFSVGMTRLELATTGPPDQHSKPTELHPVLFKAVQNYTLSVRLANFWTSFSLMPSLFCNFVL